MTSSPHGLYVPGLHTCYNGQDNGSLLCEEMPISKTWSQFGWLAATRQSEAGIASNRRSARSGEYVPGPCTHRPSHHESCVYQKSLYQPRKRGKVPKVCVVIGVKS